VIILAIDLGKFNSMCCFFDTKTLDQRIGRVKNTIRSLFANQGIEIPRGAKAWFSGREELNSHRKPLAECSMEELWRGQLDLELAQFDALFGEKG
jgi:hypothetical protein